MMRNIVLFDREEAHGDLLPLSFTRPIADFRVGITTIREKWQDMLPGRYTHLPVGYLREKFAEVDDGSEMLFISGSVLPDAPLVEAVESLRLGCRLMAGEELVALCGTRRMLEEGDGVEVQYDGEIHSLHFLYDVFLLNGEAIRADFSRLSAGRQSQPLSMSNTVIGDYMLPDGTPSIFIEEGASVEGATLNVKEGPIYIGKDAVIMEGACVRGPLALCEKAKINMGAKIYGATTFGPYCKVGGEVNNSVIFGYSNKAHDGYLGNAVIGEWCNIGAGTNCSNLKNDYSKIRLWNYPRHTFMRTDLQFCGLMMGDHSKAGINCMFNTATVVGVGCNIHGSGFPRVFIPSFSEGSPTGGFTDVSLKKFFDIATRVMSRRDKELTEVDHRIFERVYEVASSLKH